MARREKTEPDAVERAWEALEGDPPDPEQALVILKRADERDPNRHVVAAVALLALDDPAGAREALDRADALDLPADDPDGLWTRGDLLLREWRIGEAEAVFETLAKHDRFAEVVDRLAFCAELRHDRARADHLQHEAERLDAESFPVPPRLSDREFMKEIDAAVAELPEQFQRILDECRVEVLPVPTLAIAREGDLADVAPDTLGLFSGPSLMERGIDGPPELPPVIYLFQRNLERSCRDEETLIEEIRVTLYHELGHMLGFDEEGVDRMGLG